MEKTWSQHYYIFSDRKQFFTVCTVKPRANGRNIVGQQLPTLLHTLLHVVACCWELLRKVWNWSNFIYYFLQLRANGLNNVASVSMGPYEVICMVYRSTHHGQLLSICLRVLPSSSSQRPETRATKWGSFLRVPDLSRTESLTLMISSPRWTPL